MPRSRIWGFLAVLLSLSLASLFVYSLFVVSGDVKVSESFDLQSLSSMTYYALVVPIILVTLCLIGTGFWIGWTILTIKVVPPMPEIVEKKDHSKIKAFILCLLTLCLGGLLIYGIHIRNFWALAIPASIITLVILGAVFWVGIAIITTRTTLPEEKTEN